MRLLVVWRPLFKHYNFTPRNLLWCLHRCCWSALNHRCCGVVVVVWMGLECLVWPGRGVLCFGLAIILFLYSAIANDNDEPRTRFNPNEWSSCQWWYQSWWFALASGIASKKNGSQNWRLVHKDGRTCDRGIPQWTQWALGRNLTSIARNTVY